LFVGESIITNDSLESDTRFQNVTAISVGFVEVVGDESCVEGVDSGWDGAGLEEDVDEELSSCWGVAEDVDGVGVVELAGEDDDSWWDDLI
jgi:hypothetical protein